ncbi:MAG TPA: recombination protein O N-terminal domain-containing protein [Candidatus Peribacteraceae bacterium]|nr:recombination protein O N-terminal domain-containing protein [Candidatus Peribacteraceae bacterium]
MPRTFTCDAIVLRAYDVGDADRYCVLFTRERGRLAARARGARKLQSRLGGSLLSHQQLRVSLHEGKTGFLVTGAVGSTVDTKQSGAVDTFLRREQISELLLKLLHDEQPLPDVFELTVRFLNDEQSTVKQYTEMLLQHLGLLPKERGSMTPNEWRRTCRDILAEHASGAWKAATVAHSIMQEK